MLNNTETEPVSVDAQEIKCPMTTVDQEDSKKRQLKEHDPENKQSHGFSQNDFGSVPFGVKIDGVEQKFGNFHYYR